MDGVVAIVPTLDEVTSLPRTLADLSAAGVPAIVADGGSTDGTVPVARAAGAVVVEAPRGRAAQLREGAARADADWLFFLHADSRFDGRAADALSRFLADADSSAFAHFRFALEGRAPFHRFIEVGQRLRERLTGLVYGDQGLIVARALYERAGGYPDWPLLEDVGMVERLVAVGGRPVRLEATLPTSPRRYDRDGRFREWLRNIAIITLYRAGVAPERLARLFPKPPTRESRTPAAPTRTVAVFAKAPRPGWVKTRLAADLGDEEAARIYRSLGRTTVHSLRDAGFDLTVFYDPPDRGAREEVAAWLGEGLRYRPQAPGDLGARMAHAVTECLKRSEEVCVVGTDVPGLGPVAVQHAFDALSRNDLVVGPATDGGYYLLAMNRLRPWLFQNVPWSTPAVLPTTLARAAEHLVRVELLPEKTDVDTVADLAALAESGSP